jgi:hypothetical protein
MWKVRRLLAMSPAEVGLRVARGIVHRTHRSRTPEAQRELLSAESVLATQVAAPDVCAWIERELARGRGRLLAGARDVPALSSALSKLGAGPESTIDAAESVLEGSVLAFGWAAMDVGEAPDWLRDPVSGGRWPLEFWSDVEFRETGGLADPRYVWEVNRQHHLVTLARGYVLSGETRFAERVWRDIVSWIEANPPLFGINWSSPLEIAIRLMSWAMALDLIGADGVKDGDAALVAASVSLQVGHLSDNLSVYASSRNNHLIGEAAGLFVTGAKFPFLRRAERLSRAGRRVLERELIAQVSADGVTREQAFQYQSFVLEFALLGLAAGASTGTSLAPDCVEIIGGMSRFLSNVSGIGGVPPCVGDGDGGRALGLSDSVGRQAAEAVVAGAMAAGETPRGSFAAADLAPALWLFGPDVVAELAGRRAGGSETDGEAASCFFAEGGYFVPSSKRQHGVIDCGPLGYLSIAAHGHADCLSLSVSHGGHWILVDPGTFCYHRDALWRDHFRSTPAHNTVSVDGLSQSKMLGPFMWGRRARAEQIAWVTTPGFDYFEGAHDGYAGAGRVRHRRSILFGKRGYWLVVDHLEGEGRHRIDATFQLARGFSRRAGGGLVFTSGDGTAVEFRTWLPGGMTTEVFEGVDAPPRGWVSEGFGQKDAAPAVIVGGDVELPVTILTAVIPFDGENAVDVDCLTGEWNGGAVFEIVFPEGRDRVLFGAPRLVSPGEHFSGAVGFVTERKGGSETVGFNVTEWTKAGSDVMREPVENILSIRGTRGARPRC